MALPLNVTKLHKAAAEDKVSVIEELLLDTDEGSKRESLINATNKEVGASVVVNYMEIGKPHSAPPSTRIEGYPR